MTTKMDKRFFESTRGQIIRLLRGTTKSVSELAEELELTDNAVRAQLLSLERDGLIHQSGMQRGTRKPHFAYELTSEAEKLFPKAYDAVLTQLIAVLKGQLTPAALEKALREVGSSLARSQTGGTQHGDFESRLRIALTALEAIGGTARIEKNGGNRVITSDGCPLAAVVSEHPEVCRLAETLMFEIIGEKVQERCDRQGSPRCRFEVMTKK
jgi:predicted ArsR family transcriptional regulator